MQAAEFAAVALDGIAQRRAQFVRERVQADRAVLLGTEFAVAHRRVGCDKEGLAAGAVHQFDGGAHDGEAAEAARVGVE